MSQDLMMDVAEKHLHKVKKSSFEDLFEAVKAEKLESWVTSKAFKGRKESSVIDAKRGEFYTHLTTDGGFIILPSGEWSLAQFYNAEEVKKLRVNVENLDLDVD